MSVPFCWQDKRMLRRIRESIEDYGSALAVYNALTVAASDKETEEFQTTHAWLAQMSGFGERTVRSRLAELTRIGVVTITTPALRGPCTYRLLAFGNGCQTNGNQCRAFGKVSPLPLPGSECTEERKGTPKPRSISERISAEKRLNDLRQKRQRLKEDTSESWQRAAYPDRLKDLSRLDNQIAEQEAALR